MHSAFTQSLSSLTPEPTGQPQPAGVAQPQSPNEQQGRRQSTTPFRRQEGRYLALLFGNEQLALHSPGPTAPGDTLGQLLSGGRGGWGLLSGKR